MSSNGFIEKIGFLCPNCQIVTAGIIEDKKRVCPICKRELWHCPICHHLTFG